jgi:hypothetical protein
MGEFFGWKYGVFGKLEIGISKFKEIQGKQSQVVPIFTEKGKLQFKMAHLFK